MDDQFNGRTDDDLFADDFEPAAAAETEVSSDVPEEQTQDVPHESSSPVTNALDAQHSSTTAEVPAAPPPLSAPRAPKSLSQSRHNRPAASSRPAEPISTDRSSSMPNPSSNPDALASARTPASSNEATTGSGGNSNGRPSIDARLQSGGNPRAKLTEEELTVRMEKMRILSAEKARKFEQAQRDENEHAAAYARGMEEARRRRVADEERRRHDAEGRRRMDEERARNRERKLQAMGMKEGGWDQGKEERLREEERGSGRGFRGANGGIRGARDREGLPGDQYTAGGGGGAYDRRDSDRSGGERGLRAGRGRYRGGRGGRGNRGGFADGDRTPRAQDGPDNRVEPLANQHLPVAEDFPTLLSGVLPPKVDTNTPQVASDKPFSPPALSPGIGQWDDEMAAIDAKARS